MPEVTVTNAPLVTVATAIAGGRLVLTVNGVAIGTVIDEFIIPPAPPATMQLFIQNLPDSSPVSAQWQVAAGDPWFPFAQGSGGVYANFAIPTGTGQSSTFNFVAVAFDHGLYVKDPKLVLKTKT